MATNQVKDLLQKIENAQIEKSQLQAVLPQLIKSDFSKVPIAEVEALAERISDFGLVEEYEEIIFNGQYQENKLLLSETELIISGGYFPTCNPYTEKEDIARLQKGVERDLYTQDQLDTRLYVMRASNTYQRLRKSHERRFQLDHTPFASRGKECLKDYGFHVFVGREVFDEGHEVLVTLDAVAGTSYDTLNQALKDISSAAEKGRRVLLSKSPGRWECPPGRPSLAPRTYLPFDETQMSELQQQFEANPKMLKVENPFNYQP